MERGLGTVYLRGKTWWIQYYLNSEPFRESSNSSKKMVAKELLRKRLGEVSEGKPLPSGWTRSCSRTSQTPS